MVFNLNGLVFDGLQVNVVSNAWGLVSTVAAAMWCVSDLGSGRDLNFSPGNHTGHHVQRVGAV